jgi:phosphohistidine phosphatase
MKTLFLLRHAKSSWDHPGLEDFRRPLAPRGEKAAVRMGRYMARQGLVPERVICSGAVRAVQTWELLETELRTPVPWEIRDEIYHAGPEDLLAMIREVSCDDASLLLVGHNPTFETVALHLTGSGDAEARRSMEEKFPTGALAVLDFRIPTWDRVARGGASIRAFIRPRTLG